MEARELTVAETVCLIGVAVIMYSPRRVILHLLHPSQQILALPDHEVCFRPTWCR